MVTAKAQQQATQLQSLGCDPTDCQKLAGFNFNFLNLIALAQKDGPLVAQLIKDILAAFSAAGVQPAP